MINLAIALLSAVLLAVLASLAGLAWQLALAAAFVLFLVLYFFLGRRIVLKVMALIQQAHLEIATPSSSTAEQAQHLKRAIALLEGGLVYTSWQFVIGRELHAQLGMLKYQAGDMDGAEMNLLRTHRANALARAVLGALKFKTKAYSQMQWHFEQAVKVAPSEPIFWAAYAWCEHQRGETEAAQKILSRGLKAIPSNEFLTANLQTLQAEKKIRMNAYEPLWWQLGLESPPPAP